jgi:hypothetical protein
MKTKLIASMLFGLILSTGVYTNEPSNATWDWNLTVERVNVGDFNVAEGKITITCANNGTKIYTIDCGPQWASLAYVSIMEAQARGKRIAVKRDADPYEVVEDDWGNTLATLYRAYTIAYYN